MRSFPPFEDYKIREKIFVKIFLGKWLKFVVVKIAEKHNNGKP